MPYHRLMTMLLGLGALSACDASNDAQNDNGADVSVSIDGGNGTLAANGETGRVSIDIGGLTGDIKLPKLDLGDSDVDVAGVKLPSGAKVTGIDVDAPAGEDRDDGNVSIRFDAPDAPEAVQRHFLDGFKAKGVKASADGTGIKGTDKKGKPFTLTLAKQGDGTRGMILFGPKAG